MPLYDFECQDCGVFEEFASISTDEITCACGRTAVKRFSFGSDFRADAAWVRDCTVPFDPEDKRPEVREYLANPSDRHALRRAERAAGIRHMEPGEQTRPRKGGGDLTHAQRYELIQRHKARAGLL